MTIKRTFLIINALTICVILLAAVLLTYLSGKTAELEKTAEDRLFSILLVDELRKSSEELTRQVRNYAATGQAEAENTYNKVLDVRGGIVPRPAGALIAPSEKRVLLDLLKEYGITNEEFAMVEKANGLSDALVALEVKAMNAVKGIFMDSDGQYTIHERPDNELAMSLVFGSAYDNEVRKIMEPMNEFESKVHERTGRAMYRSNQTTKDCANNFICFAV
jgi:methyl-accepting chemotaxis protein